MANIEELLGLPTEEIEKLLGDPLLVYFQPILSLEPKALPATLGSAKDDPEDGTEKPLKAQKKTKKSAATRLNLAETKALLFD